MTKDSNSDNDRKTYDVYRSAITGQFVRENYADRHPDTTEHERYHKQNS